METQLLTDMHTKPIIYQLIPRLFTNICPDPVPGGDIVRNGCGKLNDITPGILREIRSLGATHVWYTGVIEHAHDTDYTAHGIPRHNPHVIKGHAGSPYAITDYYDIDPDLAVNVDRRLDEFDALVARTHRQRLKVIIDFVPNHVARQYCSDAKPAGVEDLGASDDKGMFFAPSNNFYYITGQQFAPHVDMGDGDDAYVEFPAKASGNDCFTASPGINDWYDTIKLNYGIDPWNGSRHFSPVPSTWHKMLHILRYWCGKGVDGFRCDMVHMVPVEFWQWAIDDIRRSYPSVTFIAEIYDTALYRPYLDAGFDYLYDKVNLYDTLRAIECNGRSAASLTSCWQTVDGIGHRMLNFLENHDEQRFASPQYASDPTRVLPSLVVSAMMSTGPMMIYAGQELGEPALDAEGYSGLDGRTTIFDYWAVPTLRSWLGGTMSSAMNDLRRTYARILTLCNTEAAIREGRFFDLMYVNCDNPAFDPMHQYAFLRAAGSEAILIVVNFADRPVSAAVNIPAHAFDILSMPQGPVKMRDLLSGTRSRKAVLSPSAPVLTDITAHGAAILKITPA